MMPLVSVTDADLTGCEQPVPKPRFLLPFCDVVNSIGARSANRLGNAAPRWAILGCFWCASCETSEPAAPGAAGGAGFFSEGGSAGGGDQSGAGQLGMGQAGTGQAGSGQGGTGGAQGGTEDAAPPCDPAANPADEACVISEDHGWFVAPEGVNAPDRGTRAHPFASIQYALSQIGSTKRRLYICAGGESYNETLSIGSELDGVELYGGFDCGASDGSYTENWTYSGVRAQIVSPDPVAARLQNLTVGSRLQALEIWAANAKTAGGSSLGMIVSDSRNVELRDLKIVAGNAANGTDGPNGVRGTNGDRAGIAPAGLGVMCGSNAAQKQLGAAWPTTSSCGSKGGNGGTAYMDATVPGDPGGYGLPLSDVTPVTQFNGGAGSSLEEPLSAPGQEGLRGSPGNAGPNGERAAALGTFSATGYAPADGTGGADGFPGQGGGGGGASKGNGVCVGASGGAGGLGGCGGTRGTGGQGGGASIALLVWQSQVFLRGGELVAGNGGAGGGGGSAGDGGTGADGGQGGLAGGGIGTGGDGGPGGQGGPGGSGSGGSGGPSVALVHDPTSALTLGADSLLTPGRAGTPGMGGAVLGFGTNPAPDGSAGVSQAELSIGV